MIACLSIGRDVMLWSSLLSSSSLRCAAGRQTVKCRALKPTCSGRYSARHSSTGQLENGTLKLKALGSLYARWHELKIPLPKQPPGDITIELPYSRLRSLSSEGPSPRRPLRIVAFHGAPGAASDFDALAKALGAIADIDFVAPCFPDLQSSLDRRVFWHSSEEKLGLAEALLEGLGIQGQVDLAIGHSAGSYAALLMGLYAERVKAKSVVLIATTGFRIVPVNQPEWLMKHLMKYLWIRPLDRLVRCAFELGIRMKPDLNRMTAYDALSSQAAQYATWYWSSHRGPQWCRDVYEKGVPLSLVCSLRDKLMPPRYHQWLTEDLGVPDEKDHFIYEGKLQDELKLVNKPLLDGRRPEFITFRDGGHFAFQQFPDVVAQHIIDFVRRRT